MPPAYLVLWHRSEWLVFYIVEYYIFCEWFFLGVSCVITQETVSDILTNTRVHMTVHHLFPIQ